MIQLMNNNNRRQAINETRTISLKLKIVKIRIFFDLMIIKSINQKIINLTRKVIIKVKINNNCYIKIKINLDNCIKMSTITIIDSINSMLITKNRLS